MFIMFTVKYYVLLLCNIIDIKFSFNELFK